MREWEYFLDLAYFHLWAVRPKGDKNFNSCLLFHLTDKSDAIKLTELLNKAK